MAALPSVKSLKTGHMSRSAPERSRPAYSARATAVHAKTSSGDDARSFVATATSTARWAASWSAPKRIANARASSAAARTRAASQPAASVGVFSTFTAYTDALTPQIRASSAIPARSDSSAASVQRRHSSTSARPAFFATDALDAAARAA